MKGRMLLPTAGLIALSAAAQEGSVPTEPAPALPLYRVEVILFAHADANPSEELFGHARPGIDAALPQTLEEIDSIGARAIDARELGLPPADPGRPATDRGAFAQPLERRARTPIELDPLDDLRRDTAAARPDGFDVIDPFGDGRAGAGGATAFRFRLLGPGELQLDREFGIVERLGAYRTLAHAGWVQEGLDLENSRPMNLAYLGVTNPTGTLRLYVSRFLHLVVDLEYQAGRPLRTSDGEDFGSFALRELATQPRYAFQMERNAFRSGQLQYLDHPMFGILVLVTPAPEELEAVEEVEEIQDDTSVLSPGA